MRRKRNRELKRKDKLGKMLRIREYRMKGFNRKRKRMLKKRKQE